MEAQASLFHIKIVIHTLEMIDVPHNPLSSYKVRFFSLCVIKPNMAFRTEAFIFSIHMMASPFLYGTRYEIRPGAYASLIALIPAYFLSEHEPFPSSYFPKGAQS
jgi:hypothetical protein